MVAGGALEDRFALDSGAYDGVLATAGLVFGPFGCDDQSYLPRYGTWQITQQVMQATVASKQAGQRLNAIPTCSC